MKPENWPEIHHFHAGENWGDWTKLSFDFVKMLDTVRHLTETPFELTSPAWTPKTGHSQKSYHYIGRAADFWMPRKTPFEAYDSLLETFRDMMIYQRIGFGFYPDWLTPGFHLDDRAMHIGIDYSPGVVWVRIDSTGHRLPLGYHYGTTALKYIERIRGE